MFREIVVGFDGSDPSRRAFERAVEMARAEGGRVTLVYAFDPVPFTPLEVYGVAPPTVRSTEIERAHKMLQHAAERADNVKTDVVVETGYPADVLVETAKARKADLVVVGSRGMRAIGRFMLGSVSDRVVHMAPCAVLVVH
ncbi:MAG: universal stress protein [Deltaproteobacteria bacterium]|nr:universal stress protein [Deltaproteobacteria bacterium]